MTKCIKKNWGIDDRSHLGRFEVLLTAEASADPPRKAIEDVAEELISKKLTRRKNYFDISFFSFHFSKCIFFSYI